MDLATVKLEGNSQGKGQQCFLRTLVLGLLILCLALSAACQPARIMYVGDSPNVALIIANRGDMGFNDSAVIGLTVSEQEHGTNLTIYEHDNKPEHFERVFLEAVNGYNHVVITSSALKETLEKHAPAYPNIKFLLYDGEVDWSTGNLANVYCIVYRANEAAYLAGYLAAATTETGKIGFIGGVDNANIEDFAVGYIAGALRQNPDIRVSVDFTGSFDDNEKGKDIVTDMSANDVDIVFAAAGTANLEILSVLAEHDLSMIGVNTDQYALLTASGREDLASHVITSVTKDISDALYQAIDNYTTREVITGETKIVGLKEGGVSLAKNAHYSETVPLAIQEELDLLEQDIIAGTLIVPSTRTLSAADVQALFERVKPE